MNSGGKLKTKDQARPERFRSFILRILGRPSGRILFIALVWFVVGSVLASFLFGLTVLVKHQWLRQLLENWGVKTGTEHEIITHLLSDGFAWLTIYIAGGAITALIRPRRIISWIFRSFLRINTSVGTEGIAHFRAYFDAEAEKIRNSLPVELSWAWVPEQLQSDVSLFHAGLINAHGRQERTVTTAGSKDASAGQRQSTAAISAYINNVRTYVEDNYILNPTKSLPPLNIQGEPGSGKSMFLFHLFGEYSLSFCRNCHGWIPLLILANELSYQDCADSDTLKELLLRYYTVPRKRSLSDAARIIEKNYDVRQFLIIIDALDELPNREAYDRTVDRLKVLIEKERASDQKTTTPNRYIISCRIDDNLDRFLGALLTIEKFTFAQTKANLRALRRYFKRNNPDRAQRIRQTLIGLKVSANRKLLLNYTSNPYLLSLICTYYQEQSNPPTGFLGEVFEQVLKRELLKAPSLRDSQLTREEEVKLLSYYKSVLAPFYFFRAYEPDQNTHEAEQGVDAFERSLRAGLGVGKFLFRENGLSEYYAGNRDAPGIRHAINGWSPKEGDWFMEELFKLREVTSQSYFERYACNALRTHTLAALAEAKLVILRDEKAGEPQLMRLRHRRLQDYFAAHCLGTEPQALSMISDKLHDAWFKEPLRVFAATSVNLEPVMRAIYSQAQAININTDQQKLVRLLENAAAAIEYFPRDRYKLNRIGVDPQELRDSILGVGNQAASLISGWLQQGEERSYMLYHNIIAVVAQIYSSEYVAGWRDEGHSLSILFPEDMRRLQELVVRLMRHSIRWPSLDQMETYRCLYLVASTHPELKLRKSLLGCLVMHAAPFFADDFRFTVTETRQNTLQQVPMGVIAILVRGISCAIVLTPLVFAWRSTGDFADTPSRLCLLLFAGLATLIVGFIIQINQLMSLGDSYKLPLWEFTQLLKKLAIAPSVVYCMNRRLRKAGPLIVSGGTLTLSTFQVQPNAIPKLAIPRPQQMVQKVTGRAQEASKRVQEFSQRSFANVSKAIPAVTVTISDTVSEVRYGSKKLLWTYRRNIAYTCGAFIGLIIFWWLWSDVGQPWVASWIARREVYSLVKDSLVVLEKHAVAKEAMRDVRTSVDEAKINTAKGLVGQELKILDDQGGRDSELLTQPNTVDTTQLKRVLRDINDSKLEGETWLEELSSRLSYANEVNVATRDLRRNLEESERWLQQGRKLLDDERKTTTEVATQEQMALCRSWLNNAYSSSMPSYLGSGVSLLLISQVSNTFVQVGGMQTAVRALAERYSRTTRTYQDSTEASNSILNAEDVLKRGEALIASIQRPPTNVLEGLREQADLGKQWCSAEEKAYSRLTGALGTSLSPALVLSAEGLRNQLSTITGALTNDMGTWVQSSVTRVFDGRVKETGDLVSQAALLVTNTLVYDSNAQGTDHTPATATDEATLMNRLSQLDAWRGQREFLEGHLSVSEFNSKSETIQSLLNDLAKAGVLVEQQRIITVNLLDRRRRLSAQLEASINIACQCITNANLLVSQAERLEGIFTGGASDNLEQMQQVLAEADKWATDCQRLRGSMAMPELSLPTTILSQEGVLDGRLRDFVPILTHKKMDWRQRGIEHVLTQRLAAAESLLHDGTNLMLTKSQTVDSLNEWLQRKQQTQIQLLDPLFDSRRDRVQATLTALKDMEGSISQRKDFTLESEKSRAAEDQARAAVERIHFDVSNVISSTSWSNIIAEDATLVSAKLQGIAVLSKIPAQLSSGSPGIIEAIKDDIKPNINFLNSLERQASLLAQLRSGAGDYRTQIAASLSLVTNCSNCNLGDLEKELHLRDQAISLILLRVDDFQVWEKSVGVNDLRAKLVLRDRQRTAKRQETLNTLLKVCVFSVFGGALVVFLCHLWRRYGEQKGYSELHSLPYTYDAVSRFLADSVYPQNVNDEVVDLIERCIYDELRNESPEKRVDAVRIWLEKLAKLQRQFATKGRNSADKVAKRLLQTMEGLNKTRS